jgi:predicted outer membrane protein
MHWRIQKKIFLVKLIKFHHTEIANGKMASEKEMSHDVKVFAIFMVADHTTMLKASNAFVPKAELYPKVQINYESNKLKSKKTDEFEKSYIDNEVAVHERMVKMMKKALPKIKDMKFKKFAEETATKLVRHLDHALKVQKSM